jgi:glyoxylase-like metal-dependent hydrolase (beta-lactamase superfamily II)
MRRIVPNLYMLSDQLIGRVYLISEGDGLTLVDTSIAPAAGAILRQIRALDFEPTAVKRILITHAHPDHIGALPALVAATGAEVWASRLERPVIEGTIPVPMPPRAALRGLSRLMPQRPTFFPSVRVARELADGEMLPEVLGGLQVVATPGHAPGHISFWEPEQQLLILGDVLVRFPTGLRLPFAAFTVDMAMNIRSLGRVAALEPKIVCFGHGNPLLVDTADEIRHVARRYGAL